MVELTLWQVDFLASWLIGKLTYWQVDFLACWLFGKLTVWQVDFLACWLFGKLLFGKLTFWQVDFLASLLCGKLTFWSLTISPNIVFIINGIINCNTSIINDNLKHTIPRSLICKLQNLKHFKFKSFNGVGNKRRSKLCKTQKLHWKRWIFLIW